MSLSLRTKRNNVNMKHHRIIIITLFAALIASFAMSCQQKTGRPTGNTTDSTDAQKDSAYWAKKTLQFSKHINKLYAEGHLDSMEMLSPNYKELCLEHHDMYSYYTIWGLLADKYVWCDMFDKAVAEAQRIQDDAIQRKDSLGLFTAYKVLGTAYAYQNKFDEGEKYMRKAIAQFPYNEHPGSLILTYRLLHIVLMTQHKCDEMAELQKEWKAVMDRIVPVYAKDSVTTGNWNFIYLSCLAAYYTETDDYKAAEAALDSAEYYESKAGNPVMNLCGLYNRRVWLAWKKKDYHAALKYNDRELELAKQVDDNSNLKVAMSDRVVTLDLLGRYRDALEEMQKLVDFKDSLSKIDMHDQLNELNKKFEVSELKMQAERERMESERRQFYLLIAIGVIIVIAVIVYILSRLRAAHRLTEIKAAKERIESELRIARDIQMSMVPSVFPEREELDMYASMTPAKEVGGDLYGYVLIGDKLYFCVGDVSGKGVPASLFMAQATRLFRTLAAQQMMPAEICTRMNDALSGEDNESGMFVTMFLGLADLKTGHLDFCNAGHTPPVLHSQFLQMEPNAPIGLWPGLEYKGEEMESIMNETLFIYTDGLNEAENDSQEQFGDDRLLNLLGEMTTEDAQQTVDKMKAAVEQHRAGAEPNDDLTMMCIKIKTKES